jgi:hypothetical protein
MNDFLKKVFEGDGISPSDVCLKSFRENFRGAVNVEWFEKESIFEAIFHKKGIEYIALFDSAGILLEYRQNLSPDYLPELIRKMAYSKGEIMNCVLRNKGNRLEYEVIVRDKDLHRYMITFSDNGDIKEEVTL